MAEATDTYIYLKGGRGDGFVPLWTGALSEEGMVDDGGGALDAMGLEVSEPYRDIFASTTVAGTYNTILGSSSFSTYLREAQADAVYPEDETKLDATEGRSRLSDEVAHRKPRQFVKVFTWLKFTSANGLVYKFRKADVVGWGSRRRDE